MNLIVTNPIEAEQILAGLAPSTAKTYKPYIVSFFAFIVKEGALSRHVAQKWKEELTKTMAPASVNVALSAMRYALKEIALTEGWPMAELEAILNVQGVRHSAQKSGRWLSANEVKKLLMQTKGTAVSQIRNRAMLALMLGCALRRVEVANLRWEDVKRTDGHIHLDIVGKRKKRRRIPVPSWVVKSLAQWAKVAGMKGRVMRSVNKSGVLGESLSDRAIYNVVLGLAEEAGLGEVRPHDLRRTWGRRAYDKGFDIKQISLVLGHTKIEVTETYIGIGEVDLGDGAVRVDY